ncbi:SCO family protein [Alloalcanivorax gelatiniphagus]|uniref:SCO family protein n=1 Tax=Alloalcanivorax gelatiniphagus TaxID=1194167 RepID=A0ABY2XJP6_9GAMM|nr:SCO family protein [Alloalcanivorax gelatiniphagus]TMW12172.1 SCO family protein [Alloalcanivorax gelatiniphagus]|tara:strand:- start:6310 stop:6891 length:582 start_codon:yes stop_codon:yes gene_type:complete
MTLLPALAGRLGLPGLLLALAACAEPPPELPVNTRLGGDFTLTDHRGEPFQLADQRGRVVLMFFGYTHCPDICPATLARVSQVYRNLKEAGDAERVQPLFITFDPRRDTPEHLSEYVPWFKANVIGLTGDEEQIRAVAEQYGVVYLQSADDGSGYDFTHSDYVYLLDQQGRVRKLYPSDFDIDEVIHDVQSLL